jgi:hypothetical protein
MDKASALDFFKDKVENKEMPDSSTAQECQECKRKCFFECKNCHGKRELVLFFPLYKPKFPIE